VERNFPRQAHRGGKELSPTRGSGGLTKLLGGTTAEGDLSRRTLDCEKEIKEKETPRKDKRRKRKGISKGPEKVGPNSGRN